jgi:quercetin dioxygenase-like cupin family protein
VTVFSGELTGWHGVRIAQEHRHYDLVSGEGIFDIDGDFRKVKPGSTIQIEGGQEYDWRPNEGDKLTFILVLHRFVDPKTIKVAKPI